MLDVTEYKKTINQKKLSPLLKNSLYLMLTTLAGTGSGFIFWIFGAKYYSPENVGLAAAAISAMGILSTLSRLGFDIGIIRYLPSTKDKNGMINSCITIIGIASIVSACIYLVVIKTISPDLIFIKKNPILLISFIAFTSASSLLVTQSNIFAALRDAKYSFIQNLIAISRVIALPFLTATGAIGIYFSYGIGVFAACLFGNYFILKAYPLYKLNIIVKKDVINEIFHFSFGNYIATIFEGLPNFILPLVVINVLGAEQNAYFYISWSLSAMLLMVPRATSMSLFAEGSNKKEEFRTNIIKALKFVIVALGPMIVIFYVAGKNILLFFGADYSKNAFETLQMFSFASIPYSINIFYVTVKRVQKKILEIISIYAFVGIFTIIGGYLLMQSYGLIGVGIAWIVGNGIVAITILFFASIDYMKPLLRTQIKLHQILRKLN